MIIIFRSLILLIMIAIGMAGCTAAQHQKKIPLADTQHAIYFIYRAWHTSILLDATVFSRYSKLAQRSPLLQKELHGQRYVRIGWGDGDYFTGKSKSVGSATKALVVSGYSALQVIAYRDNPFPDIAPETRVPLAITDEAMRKLVNYFDNSFALTPSGELIRLQAYVENAGVFYRAQGHYSLFSNCNTWSGRALQTAGLPIRSSFHLTAGSIFEQAQQISMYQQANGITLHVERILPQVD